jgi:SAM-dependent methyltransferase
MNGVTPEQRKDEWELDAAGHAYHRAQWLAPKQSTLAFERFAHGRLATAARVVDLGCGAGGATAYLAKEHPATAFLGIDYSSELVATAAANAKQAGLANLGFEQGDWYELLPRDDVDGVISLQTLSWLPAFQRPLQAIFERLRPRWIAVSSLFYPGEISCRIEVTEHLIDKSCFYNVYSVAEIARFCRAHGYELTHHQPFEIDIDLPKPDSPDAMGTYTVRTSDGDARRLQLSGPLLMNWRFLLIERRP